MKKIIITEEEKSHIKGLYEMDMISGILSNEELSSLSQFLRKINEGGNKYFQNWVLDSTNPKKRGDTVKLSGNEKITIPTSFFKKPLLWSLIRNGKKEEDSVFEIFHTKNGLYYQCRSNEFNRCLSGQCSNTEPYEKITPLTVNDAIEMFNERVFLQNPQ